MKTLYLMCGPAGCGKSTWIRKRIQGYPEATVVSRDKIRFSLVKENEDYFSKEDQVFHLFIKEIQAAIDTPHCEEIYVDATHITEKARNKVLDQLRLEKVEVIPVCFHIKLNTCFKQNANREGRSRVPIKVIADMYENFEKPTFSEKHNYTEIIEINGG